MKRLIFTGALYLFLLYNPYNKAHDSNIKHTTKQSLTDLHTDSKGQNVVSLLDIYEMALQNNASLAAARATFMAEREVVSQAMSPMLPQLSAGASSDYNKSIFPGHSENPRSRWNTHGWSASVTQSVFDLSNIFNMKAAYKKKHMAELTLEIARQNLIYDIASGYFAVLKAQDEKFSAQVHMRAVKKQLDQTEERYKVGMVANTDVQEAKAAYDTAKVSVIQAENDIVIAKGNLSLLTNKPVPEALSKLNQNMPAESVIPNQLSTWEQWAVSYNLAVQKAKDDVSASQYELSAARSAFLPTLSGSVSYEQKIDNTTSARIANRRKANGFTASLNINIPLFSGGSNYSKSREAGYALEAKQKTEEFVTNQAKIDVHNYYNTVNADISQISAWCQSIVSADSSLKATESGYQVGTRTIIDVLNSQSVLYNAQKQYLDSRYNYILNTLKLKQVSGTLSVKDLQYLNQWMTPPNDDSDALTPYCKAATNMKTK
ncbi:MAG: TolC family outer membrane protein [Endozoicomonadaceae bacterium]|nr:TolC family outer membrane protein [Endozoicomonadaceae bacterium]